MDTSLFCSNPRSWILFQGADKNESKVETIFGGPEFESGNRVN